MTEHMIRNMTFSQEHNILYVRIAVRHIIYFSTLLISLRTVKLYTLYQRRRNMILYGGGGQTEGSL